MCEPFFLLHDWCLSMTFSVWCVFLGLGDSGSLPRGSALARGLVSLSVLVLGSCLVVSGLASGLGGWLGGLPRCSVVSPAAGADFFDLFSQQGSRNHAFSPHSFPLFVPSCLRP